MRKRRILSLPYPKICWRSCWFRYWGISGASLVKELFFTKNSSLEVSRMAYPGRFSKLLLWCAPDRDIGFSIQVMLTPLTCIIPGKGYNFFTACQIVNAGRTSKTCHSSADNIQSVFTIILTV